MEDWVSLVSFGYNWVSLVEHAGCHLSILIGYIKDRSINFSVKESYCEDVAR